MDITLADQSYLRLLLPAWTLDVKSNPLDYFDGMLFIVHQLEIYPVTGNIDIKLYNLFPVTASCIPGNWIYLQLMDDE